MALPRSQRGGVVSLLLRETRGSRTLEGDEIGRLIAHAVEGGITERRPWYDPSENLPDRPIIDAQMNMEFETLVVDIPSAQTVRGSKGGATIGMPSPAA